MTGRTFAVLLALACVVLTWVWYGGLWALFYTTAAVCGDCKAHRPDSNHERH